jgi:hypothetical protein
MSVDNTKLKLTGWAKYDKLLLEAQEVIRDYETLKAKEESTKSSFFPKPISYFQSKLKLRR